jgi:hypothetical protein
MLRRGSHKERDNHTLTDRERRLIIEWTTSL